MISVEFSEENINSISYDLTIESIISESELLVQRILNNWHIHLSNCPAIILIESPETSAFAIVHNPYLNFCHDYVIVSIKKGICWNRCLSDG